MGHFTTIQMLLDIPTTLEAKEKEQIDIFLSLLDESNVAEILDKSVKNNTSKGGRIGYNKYRMFAMILYGFTYYKVTLRELESACKFDIRFIYIMNGEIPNYSTICKFINSFMVPYIKEIFACVTKLIFKKLDLKMDVAYIDGTKFEANANKYKFVWKPTTFHERITLKVSKIISDYNLIDNFQTPSLITSKTIALAINNLYEKKSDIECFNSVKKALESIFKKVLEYEEKEEKCGSRKSYYKTDIDATAMALKCDYYSGLGSNMHAAYNVQIMVISGFVMMAYVSQSRTDIHDFIDTIEAFHQYYQCFPEKICADAGYGSLENYKYLKAKCIKSFVKHQSWEGNVSAKYPDCYRLNEDGKTITCLNGNVGVQVELENRHAKKANNVFFKIKGCNSCLFCMYCKRYMMVLDEDFKIFETNLEFLKLKQESENNLLSPEGIEIRVNRSIQVEGAFGNEKQNRNYERIRRSRMIPVTSEIFCTLLGSNLKKYFRYTAQNRIPSFRTAPSDLAAENFKKPSAKKLSNKGKRINAKTYKN